MKRILVGAVAVFATLLTFTPAEEPKKPSVPKVEEKWLRLKAADGWIVVGGFVDIDGNETDRIYFRYGSAWDSGVEVERVKDGKLSWRIHVERLGAVHSEYSHKVSVCLEHGDVCIRSDGFARIVERHKLATGELISRKIESLK